MSPSRQVTDRWNQQLQYFRFSYALGGHANDGDLIAGQIAFTGKDQLLSIFEQMGIPLQRIPEGKERLQIGRSYTFEEYKAIAHPIFAYPEFQEPGISQVWGMPIHFSVGEKIIHVYFSGASGDPWEVSEKDFLNAQAFEREAAKRGFQLIAP